MTLKRYCRKSRRQHDDRVQRNQWKAQPRFCRNHRKSKFHYKRVQLRSEPVCKEPDGQTPLIL